MLLKKDAEELVKQRFGRDFFVTEILRGLFKIQPAEVFCLQDFVSTGFLDLTFCVLKDCVGFFEAWKKKEGHKLLEGLQLQPVFVQDFIPLTIHIYNPFVEDGDVLAFIARYCDVVRGGERLRDRYGIWNGKRRYMVKLRLDSSSPGTVLHPPGSFSIGPNRGFLHYPGQPVYCRRCGGQGHVKVECKGERCRFCGKTDHVAAECTAPKHCSLCGSKEHLYRGCPARKKSYASLFKEGEDLQADLESLMCEASNSSINQTELTAATEGANKDQGAEESAVHHQDKGPAVAEVNQPRPPGAAQEREQSQGIGQTWSDIDIAEVFSGAAIVSSNNTIQDTPQAEDPARFTWSQLDALDIITSEQSGGGDSEMEISGGRGRRRAVEEDGGGEDERDRKCSKIETVKTFVSLEDLVSLHDSGKGAGAVKAFKEVVYEGGDGGEGGMEWGECGESTEDDSQGWTEVVARRVKGCTTGGGKGGFGGDKG
ncbi:MAG: hypothetical protein ACRC8R_22545 [Aeromonas hydrophila]